MDEKKSSHGKSCKEKVCFNCLTRETPLWRRSKKGANLCNACGLYYRNHGEHRPVLRPSNYQHHPIQSEKETESSAMEKIAMHVLVEMRSRTRDPGRANRHKSDCAGGDVDTRHRSPRSSLNDLLCVPDPDLLNEKPCISRQFSDDSILCKNEDENDQSYSCIGRKRNSKRYSQLCRAKETQHIKTNEYTRAGAYRDHQLTRVRPVALLPDDGAFSRRYGIGGCHGVDDRDSEDFQDVVNRLASLPDQ